ncbi:hypothetical protein SUGI_0600880 [Cryptomeria japonica]|uniref:transcription factor GTE8-like n=1 Tax=Cryptomeria japonica TaxID=3369 RepID=UPI002414BB28|nr:transcription factor GTE8-like [Cryptomeria japonica]GLJ30369.1 hypothetical protein SUGI_0600880 [Cryptomeria japonica]
MQRHFKRTRDGKQIEGVFKGSHNFDRFGPAIKYKCMNLIQSIIRDPQSWPFREALDLNEWYAPRYKHVITQPMDLCTIRSRLQNNLYLHPMEFGHDIDLTFDNAMRYNPPSSVYHEMAKKLLQNFYSQWKPIGIEIAKRVNQTSLSGLKGFSNVKPKALKFVCEKPNSNMNEKAEDMHKLHVSEQSEEKRLVKENEDFVCEKPNSNMNDKAEDKHKMHDSEQSQEQELVKENEDCENFYNTNFWPCYDSIMDLGSVKSELQDHRHSLHREFADDVEMTIENASENDPSDEYHTMDEDDYSNEYHTMDENDPSDDYHTMDENELECFQIQWKNFLTELEKGIKEESKQNNRHVVRMRIPCHHSSNGKLSGKGKIAEQVKHPKWENCEHSSSSSVEVFPAVNVAGPFTNHWDSSETDFQGSKDHYEGEEDEDESNELSSLSFFDGDENYTKEGNDDYDEDYDSDEMNYHEKKKIKGKEIFFYNL